jgi:hypothetical protein
MGGDTNVVMLESHSGCEGGFLEIIPSYWPRP